MVTNKMSKTHINGNKIDVDIAELSIMDDSFDITVEIDAKLPGIQGMFWKSDYKHKVIWKVHKNEIHTIWKKIYHEEESVIELKRFGLSKIIKFKYYICAWFKKNYDNDKIKMNRVFVKRTIA